LQFLAYYFLGNLHIWNDLALQVPKIAPGVSPSCTAYCVKILDHSGTFPKIVIFSVIFGKNL
jgi:hypothetical protein